MRQITALCLDYYIYTMISSVNCDDIQYYMPQTAAVDRIADFFHLFSDPTRLKLLCALSIQKLCVTDISDILKINQTTVSHQLKLLRDAKLVAFERDGKILYYYIANERINDILLLGVETTQ